MPKSKAQKKREADPIEGEKTAFVCTASKTSAMITELLRDFSALKKPNVFKLKKKEDIRPFESTDVLEKICSKKRTSLFLHGALSKKRGHCITLGRLFENEVLDMVELSVARLPAEESGHFPYPSFDYISTDDVVGFHRVSGDQVAGGWETAFKPVFIFQGDWTNSRDLSMTRSVLIDMYRGHDRQTALSPASLDQTPIVVCTATGVDTFNMQVHTMELSQSSVAGLVRTETALAGMSVGLKVCRTQWADNATRKRANKKAVNIVEKLGKAKSHDAFGSTLGRIYVERQDLNAIDTRRFKGLKRKAEETGEDKKRVAE